MDSQSTFVLATSSLPGCDPLFLAWLAGFVDGEGSLMIVRDWVKGVAHYRPRIAISNTVRTPLDEIRARIAAGHVYQGVRRPKETRPSFGYVVSGRSAQRIAAAIRPYLRVKTAQADVLIAFELLPWHLRAPSSQYRLTGRAQARDEMKRRQHAAWEAARRLNRPEPLAPT